MSYVKLSAELLVSTVWREPGHVRLVWITMLAMKNEYQEVMASVPGLADMARVTRGECDDALRVLSSPDPDSRSKAEEGRRIIVIPGGWFVVNGEAYRKRESPEERRERKAAYMREHRATKTPPSEPAQKPSVPNVDGVTDHGRHVDNVDSVPSVASVTANVDSVTLGSESGPAEAEQRQSREEDPDLVEFALDGGGPTNPALARAQQRLADERAVFEAWRVEHAHPNAKLNDSKRQKIRARLSEGYTANDLIQAIKNAKLDRHLMGNNDRDTAYDGIETLLKNGSMVERLIELPSKRGGNPTSGTHRKAAPAQLALTADGREGEIWAGGK